MNGESNADRTNSERDANERMRELGRRSGEARRRKREQREKEQLEPLTDHEQAKQALRRALDGGNMAAMVAAAKALRWLQRFIDERLPPLAEAALAASALAELRHGRRNVGVETLKLILHR